LWERERGPKIFRRGGRGNAFNNHFLSSPPLFIDFLMGFHGPGQNNSYSGPVLFMAQYSYWVMAQYHIGAWPSTSYWAGPNPLLGQAIGLLLNLLIKGPITIIFEAQIYK